MLVDLGKRLAPARRKASECKRKGKESESRGSWWVFWEGREGRKSLGAAHLQEVLDLFGEFITELASVLQVHQQLRFLQHECSLLSS